MSVVTEGLLPWLRELGLRVELVDTSDRRGLGNVGKVDFANVAGALRHGVSFLLKLVQMRPDVAYLPVAQNRVGFLRDAQFLVPCRLMRVPVVVHLHGCAFAGFYRSESAGYRRLMQFALRRVAAVAVLGRSALGEFDGLVPRERVRVIANGTPDVVESAPAVSRSPAWDMSVLYLSTLSLGKGFLDLLDAVALLTGEDALGRGVRVTLAGEFSTKEARSRAENRLTDSNLQGKVRLVGPVGRDEGRRLLQEADVLVMPARQIEGQPLCILEAFSAGIPVIATRVGCIVDTVTDGVDGILVDPGSPRQLADALCALADEELRSRMSRAARKTYERCHTMEQWAEQVRSLLVEASARRTY